MPKIHITWADQTVRNTITPEEMNPILTRFQNYFSAIQHDIFQRFKPLEADRNQFTGAEGSETWFSYQAWVMRVFAETLNTTQTWVREDYREMCELLIARTCEALQSQ